MRTAVLAALWRARWFAVIAAVAGAVVGYLIGSAQPVTYTAESRVILSQTGAFDPVQQAPSGDPARHVANQASVALTRPVLQAAAEQLGGEVTADTLMTSTDVATEDGSDVFVVTAHAPSAATAAAQANEVVTAYRQSVAARVTAEAAATVAATTDATLINTIRASVAAYGDGVAQVEPATAEAATSSSHPVRPAVALAVVGALAAVGLRAWQQSREPDLAPLVDAARAPVIGIVPVRGQPPPGEEVVSQSGATALATLEFARAGRPGPLLFGGLSLDTPTGRVVRELASAAAAQGRRVAVVELRPAPGAQPFRPGSPPLDGRPPAAAARAPVTHLRPTSAQVQNGFAEHDLLRLAESFDLVFVDSGPMAWTATGLAIAARAAVVVAVVDVGADPEVLRRTTDRLDAASCSLTGLLVTDSRRRRGDAGVSAARAERGWKRRVPRSRPRSRPVKHAATT